MKEIEAYVPYHYPGGYLYYGSGIEVASCSGSDENPVRRVDGEAFSQTSYLAKLSKLPGASIEYTTLVKTGSGEKLERNLSFNLDFLKLKGLIERLSENPLTAEFRKDYWVRLCLYESDISQVAELFGDLTVKIDKELVHAFSVCKNLLAGKYCSGEEREYDIVLPRSIDFFAFSGGQVNYFSKELKGKPIGRGNICPIPYTGEVYLSMKDFVKLGMPEEVRVRYLSRDLENIILRDIRKEVNDMVNGTKENTKLFREYGIKCKEPEITREVIEEIVQAKFQKEIDKRFGIKAEKEGDKKTKAKKGK